MGLCARAGMGSVGPAPEQVCPLAGLNVGEIPLIQPARIVAEAKFLFIHTHGDGQMPL